MDYVGIGLVTQWMALASIALLLWKIRHRLNPMKIDWSNPAHVFIISVGYHFIMNGIDAANWQIIWYAVYFEMTNSEGLVRLGVLQNIPFRHLGQILIAYGHLRALQIQTGEPMGYFWRVISCVGVVATYQVFF